jgi:hypothetical protein
LNLVLSNIYVLVLTCIPGPVDLEYHTEGDDPGQEGRATQAIAHVNYVLILSRPFHRVSSAHWWIPDQEQRVGSPSQAPSNLRPMAMRPHLLSKNIGGQTFFLPVGGMFFLCVGGWHVNVSF